MAITALFDTGIALVLHFMVIEGSTFPEVFFISQFTGLSICSFVHLGMWISQHKLNGWIGPCIAGGLMTGIAVGGILSWGFVFFFHDPSIPHYYSSVFPHIAVFGFVFGVPIIYFFMSREQLAASEQKVQDEKIRRLTMEKEAAMTSLQLLQAQIEPHFLFNTLSNVIMLLELDTDKAKKMLIDVNEYLRISLDRTRQETITLSQELDLVRRYLEIFKIRMGKRLSYEINDRTGRSDFMFPPLIIQPLVENAVKYGLEPKVKGGQIVIDCRLEDSQVVIEVSDTGCGLDESANQAGIGINNVSQRLASVYGEKAGLTLMPNNPCGLKATIKVPV